MKGNKKKNLLEYNEESDESSYNDNEFKDIEGDNIVIRDKKKKIKKDLNNFDNMKEDLKNMKGKIFHMKNSKKIVKKKKKKKMN